MFKDEFKNTLEKLEKRMESDMKWYESLHAQNQLKDEDLEEMWVNLSIHISKILDNVNSHVRQLRDRKQNTRKD